MVQWTLVTATPAWHSRAASNTGCHYTVHTKDILINASPETILQLINHPENIQPEELKSGFAYRIGVPFPIQATTLEGKIGGKRELIWQRGIKFEEEITAWELNRHIAWTYKFNADSFPSGSLDDHIVIGGKYFNLEDTSYTLTPEASGTPPCKSK